MPEAESAPAQVRVILILLDIMCSLCSDEACVQENGCVQVGPSDVYSAHVNKCFCAGVCVVAPLPGLDSVLCNYLAVCHSPTRAQTQVQQCLTQCQRPSSPSAPLGLCCSLRFGQQATAHTSRQGHGRFTHIAISIAKDPCNTF